jgi:hypothetical protein
MLRVSLQPIGICSEYVIKNISNSRTLMIIVLCFTGAVTSLDAYVKNASLSLKTIAYNLILLILFHDVLIKFFLLLSIKYPWSRVLYHWIEYDRVMLKMCIYAMLLIFLFRLIYRNKLLTSVKMSWTATSYFSFS